jgi:hypothetical protein
MIKKFENFINESVDSNISEIGIIDLKKIIEKAKPGDKISIICHFVVSAYVKNRYKPDSVHTIKPINCSSLSPHDKLDTLLSDKNSCFILDDFERTDPDVLKILMSQMFENKDSIFIIFIDNAKENREMYNDFVENNLLSIKDRFNKLYKVVLD